METFGIKFALPIVTKKVDYPYQALGLEMQSFYPPSNRPRLWALFYKYQEAKIRDAFITCQKKYRTTQEEKYKSFNYMVGVLKNL